MFFRKMCSYGIGTLALAAWPLSVQAAGDTVWIWNLFQEPIVEAFLAAIIFLSIVAEIKTAGFSGGGLIATIAGSVLLVANWGVNQAGILEFILYFGGMALIFIDILLLLSGVTAVAGLVCMIVGLFLTFGANTTALFVLTMALLLAAVGSYFLLKYLPESVLWKKVVLSSSLRSEQGFVSSAIDLEPFVGHKGVSISVLRPSGKVRVDDHVLDAVTEGGFLEPHTDILVVRAEGNHVIVKSFS